MVVANPLEYFDESVGCVLDESLVLRLLFHPQDQSIDLVVDYAAEAVSSAFSFQLAGGDIRAVAAPPRDLRHFRFSEVFDLKLEREPNIAALDWRQYEAKILAKPQVLTGVKHAPSNGGYQISFLLGRFGKHVICYRTFMVGARLAEAKTAGPQTWQYFDLKTGERIDFHNPFPEIDAAKKVVAAAKG